MILYIRRYEEEIAMIYGVDFGFNIIGMIDLYDWLYRGYCEDSQGDIKIIYLTIPENLEISKTTIEQAIKDVDIDENGKYIRADDEGSIKIFEDFVRDGEVRLHDGSSEIIYREGDW